MGRGSRPVGSMEVRLAGLRRVLCLGAHADDIEIGCAGTVLRLLEQNKGLEVYWVVLSATGERGREARSSAASILRAAAWADVRVADFEESFFPYNGGEIKRYMARLGSEIAPDLVMTHWRGDAHQDHRLVAELTWNTFRGPLILEYEVPKWDGDMSRPNFFVSLAHPLCARKIEHVLRAFPSQANKPWFTAETFWGLLRLRGVESRSASGYAEAFHCRKLVLG